MPRPPRDPGPGFFHAGVGAAGPVNYFRDEVDHAAWTRFFVAAADRYGWEPIAFCQMSTHWHGLFWLPEPTLSAGMQFLNTRYSRAFNARHGRVGYFVRDRFWSRRKSSETDLLTCYRYVANNPVEAGCVRRAEDWFWSSYATTIGVLDAFPFVDASRVLGLLADDRSTAVERLRRFIAAR